METDTTRHHFDAKDDYWFNIYAQTRTFPGYNLRQQHETTLARLAAHLPNGGRVLDVGCGAGFTVLELVQQGYQVSGVDFAPNMIIRAQREAKNRHLAVDFRVADAESLPYNTASFDAVIALGLMGNLTQDQPTLREMHRVLKEGGLLVLSMPNYCGLDRWLSFDYPLILGYHFVRLRRTLINIIRRLLGRQPKPLSAIRYGRSAVPWRYTSLLRQVGFTRVGYTALTFGTFTPFGLKLWSDQRHITISQWITRHLRRWLNWGGNMMLYYGEK
jgi:ubiquinone/menaquinone biosynthesis C-methylase UbiE